MAFKKGLHRFSFVTMFFIRVHTFRNNDIQIESSFILISKNQTLNIKAPRSDVKQFLVTESPVRWWEAPFLFFRFLFWLFLLCWKNDLISKLGLILKFVTSQTDILFITLHILSNISRKASVNKVWSKYNMRNVALEISYAILLPDPFLQTQN